MDTDKGNATAQEINVEVLVALSTKLKATEARVKLLQKILQAVQADAVEGTKVDLTLGECYRGIKIQAEATLAIIRATEAQGV